MKRLYYYAITILLCLIALTGYARAQIETLHEKTIEGVVFEDLNENGINDHEPGVGGINVYLHQCPDGPAIASTKTSYHDGSYTFKCSSDWDQNASYFIEFELFDKTKTFTSYRQGHDDRNDSDVDPETGRTDCLSFLNNEKSVDAGLIPSNFIGNFVWFDSNGDGLQNEQMNGIGNIRVELYSYISENNKQFLRSIETDYKGNYKFSYMQPGTYCLRFVIPQDMTGKYDFTDSYGSLSEGKNSDADHEGWTLPFTLTSDNMPKVCIDAGLKTKTVSSTGCIGDFVWFDKNGNGIQEQGEPGVSGVTVELYSCQWNHAVHSLLGTTTTNTDGYYSFTNLSPGTYCLKFKISQDYQFTTRTGSLTDCNNSDAQDDGSTIPIILSDNYMSNNCVDAGLLPKAPPATGCIGDFVWLDSNQDGYQYGEQGMANVTVRLYSSSGVFKASTTTDGNGHYNFTNLEAGRYYVKFILPQGYLFTKNIGSLNDQSNSDVPPYDDGKTASFDLAEGESNPNIDAGLIAEPPPATGCIGDFVWFDANGNGYQDQGEAGIKGARVELYSCQDYHKTHTLLNVTFTDANGYYSFNNLKPGTYCIKFYTTDDYIFTVMKGSINDGNNSDADYEGATAPITLWNGYMTNRYIDAGMVKKTPPATGCIGDFVWYDANGNGYQDSGEPGIKNARVELFSCQYDHTVHSFLGSTFTDDNGFYSFTGLTAGTYCVKFYTVDDMQFTIVVGSQNDGNNSDAAADGSTKPITLADGYMTNRAIDAGMIKKTPPATGCIGDFVWFDSNGNGYQESGEPGIQGVRVELYSCQWDHSTHVFQASTVTDNNGYYSFTNLKAGTYCVKFCSFDGYKFTVMTGSLNDCNNSDADYDGWAKAVTIADGYMTNRCIDAGMVLKEIKKASLGDLVWRDKDEDGIQDDGLNEPGLPNVVVELYQSGTNALIGTDVTDSKGKYLFENLSPGHYYVKFILADGFKFTKMDKDGDNLDSDADPMTGKTADINLGNGAYNMSVDAGMFGSDCLPASIGNFVWNDLNVDGLQNNNEPGIPNVTVKLFKCGQSNAWATTKTDANGFYMFAGLMPGNYYLQFMLFDGFAFTYIHQGNNDALDSDAGMTNGVTDGYDLSSGEVETSADAGMFKGQCLLANLGDLVWLDSNRNGIQDAGETGMEGVVLKLHLCTSSHTNPGDPCQCGPEIASRTTDKVGRYMFNNIMPGRYCVEIVVPCHYTISNPDQADDWKDSDIIPSMKHTACIQLTPGETNNTVDAGLYPTPPATIGDLVWIDANKNGLQDNGEKGLCNVNVELYMCGVGSPVAATKTDNDGKYIFKNVIANTSYAVKFYLPKGYTFTALDQGNNDNYDSDVCAKTCGGMTKFYDVLPDEVNLTIDCGMYLATTSACNYVWNDLNSNGLKDEGESGIHGVTVELYNCSSNTLAQSTKTDAAGLFTFTDILLDSYYLKVVIPEGYTISNSSQPGDGEGVASDFGSNGQSSCFEITDTTKSIGKPIALVVKAPTGVAYRSGTPTVFSLLQNYPNPFNPSTTIEFAVPEAGHFSLKIYNMLGQEVLTLIDRELPIGYHMAVFDASRMPSGVYIYRLTGKNVMLTKKMMLSK